MTNMPIDDLTDREIKEATIGKGYDGIVGSGVHATRSAFYELGNIFREYGSVVGPVAKYGGLIVAITSGNAVCNLILNGYDHQSLNELNSKSVRYLEKVLNGKLADDLLWTWFYSTTTCIVGSIVEKVADRMNASRESLKSALMTGRVIKQIDQEKLIAGIAAKTSTKGIKG